MSAAWADGSLISASEASIEPHLPSVLSVEPASLPGTGVSHGSYANRLTESGEYEFVTAHLSLDVFWKMKTLDIVGQDGPRFIETLHARDMLPEFRPDGGSSTRLKKKARLLPGSLRDV